MEQFNKSEPSYIKRLFTEVARISASLEASSTQATVNREKINGIEFELRMNLKSIEERLREVEADIAKARGAMVAYSALGSLIVGALTLLFQFLGAK